MYELLSIPKLDGIKIIAGASGKNREVESVNMMDAPDIIHFLNRNEFLVTTAYHLKDQPHLLTKLVQTMAEQGCAGLGIKTKRFLEKIPKEAIDLANELSFPIIEIPLQLSLGLIVNHTFQSILDNRAAELTLALETHKQFTNIIMKGKGLQSLLADLAQMIGHPVQLINQHLKPIYPIHNKNLDFPLLLEGINTKKASVFSFSIIANRQTCTLFPVQTSEKQTGFLFIHGEISKHDHLTLLTIEQATNVISFSLIKENALKQQKRNIQNDFFLHFVEDAFSSHEEIIGRAAELSIPNNRKYICTAGKIDRDQYLSTYTQRHEIADDIYDFIEDEVSSYSPFLHFFKKGEVCILLFSVKEELTNNTTERIESTLLNLQKRVSTTFNHTISFGVGNLCHNFLHVKTGYKEAIDAHSQGKLSKKTGFIHTYQTKDIIELLRQIPQNDLKNYYSIALSGFSQATSEEENILLETLSVFLETHCQISETAKRLYVHRNTVVYRIEKCEEILGKSLKDPDTTLQIRLALRMRTLLEI